MRIAHPTCGLAILAALAGCGRLGFGDGSFDTISVSDAAALVGCSNSVAGDGADGFGAIWHEFPPPGGNEHAIVFSHMSAGGGEVTAPVVVDRVEASINHLELHPTERGYVAFYCHEDSSALFAAEIDRSGVLLATEEIDVPTKSLTVAPTGSGFGLFFEEDGCLHMIALDASGAPISEPIPLDIPGGTDSNGDGLIEAPSAVHTDTGYHVVFEHSWGEGLGYAHLRDDGAVVSARVDDFGAHRAPAIASDAAGRLGVTWFDDELLTEYGLDDDGEPLWSGVRQVVPVNRQQEQLPRLAGGDGKMGMVWASDTNTLLPQILFRPFELESVQASVPETVTEGLNSYSCPQIARGAGEFVISFRGEIDGRQQLFVSVRND